MRCITIKDARGRRTYRWAVCERAGKPRPGPHVLLTNAAPIARYPDLGGAIAVLKTTE
jgi:hypothetical protein